MRLLVGSAGLAIALLLAPAFLSDGRAASFARDSLVVETASGAHILQIELALTPSQRQQGLMFRETLAPDAGMLFLYEEEQPVSMWMKNTLVPLDMLFLDSDGRVVQLAERTTPLSTRVISSERPVRAVLELNAGTATRLGIKRGDRVRHRAFDSGL